MGKKKGKKSASSRALKAAEASKNNKNQNDSNDAPEEAEENFEPLDDLNASANDLHAAAVDINEQEIGDSNGETDPQKDSSALTAEQGLGGLNDESDQGSPEVKPLFAEEVDQTLLDPPEEAESNSEATDFSSGGSTGLTYGPKTSETQPLRIRKPDTLVEESPAQEYGNSLPSSPQTPKVGLSMQQNQHSGPTAETLVGEHPEGHPEKHTEEHFKEPSEKQGSTTTSPRPNPAPVDSTLLSVSQSEEYSPVVSPSRPVPAPPLTGEILRDSTASQDLEHSCPEPEVSTEVQSETRVEEHRSRATSPRPKPPPIDTTPSRIPQVDEYSSGTPSSRPLPPLPPTKSSTEVAQADLNRNPSELSSPIAGNVVSNAESHKGEKANKPTSPRPVPPPPVNVARNDSLQANNKPPLPARTSRTNFSPRSNSSPIKMTEAEEASDEELDEVPGLRSFHRAASRKPNQNIPTSSDFNKVLPGPNEPSAEELSGPRTAEMTEINLNEATDPAQASLATPIKLTKSKGVSTDQEGGYQSTTSSQNLESSAARSEATHVSPIVMRAETQSPISPPLPARGTSMKRYAVPPPLEQEMQSEEFRKNLSMTRARDSHSIPPPINRAKRMESAAEINLIANRFRETAQYYQTEDEISRENIEKGQSALKSSFSTFLESLPGTPLTPAGKFEGSQELQGTPEKESELGDDELGLLKTDWSFWTQVVNDFPSVAGNPELLEKKITEGIPEQVRGIIWQLIANSKSVEFEDIYHTLRDTASSHESSIRRDMKRTKFIPESKFESLFNVIKVYSVFDPDVGYTQGMAFIVTPLLLNTETEAEAFGLLVRLMKNYSLRNLYLPEMPGLMLMLYQFDRLLEENSPQLYNHLTRQGVRSSMYATQWFLTFFAYKFPLEFVLRIYDIVFVEGVESFLKFAVNLMLKNIHSLLDLQFDKLLDFLKEELFYYYLKTHVEQRKNDNNDNDNDNDSVLRKDVTSASSSSKQNAPQDDEYDVDQFVWDAMNDVHITPISLRRYTSEYDEIHEIEQQKEAQYESIRIKNQQLHKEIRKLEHGYTLLNREHVDIANELIKNRLKIETLNDENNDMKSTILDLKRQLEERDRKQASPSPDEGLLPSDIRQDLNRTIKRNAEVMSENLKLQDKVTELERMLATFKTKNSAPSAAPPSAAGHVPREKLSNGWSGLKKVFK